MAKTNFSKVEEILSEGLRKIKVEHLLDLADRAASPAPDSADAGTQKNPAPNQPGSRKHTLLALQRDLKHLTKQDKDAYKTFGIGKSRLKKYIEHPETLTAEEWEAVTKIKLKVDEFKIELAKTLPGTSDDDLVDQQRRKHVTKRFNINDSWVPLR